MQTTPSTSPVILVADKTSTVQFNNDLAATRSITVQFLFALNQAAPSQSVGFVIRAIDCNPDLYFFKNPTIDLTITLKVGDPQYSMSAPSSLSWPECGPYRLVLVIYPSNPAYLQ